MFAWLLYRWDLPLRSQTIVPLHSGTAPLGEELAPEKARIGDRSRNTAKLFTFDQLLPWLPPYHFCQATSLASLGGSHGKLRRVNAKAT